jgi:spermidine synthase
MQAFPNSVVWGNTNNGVGYDLVLMGQLEPIKIDVDALQAKLDDPRYAQVAQSLREIGIFSAIDLLSNYAGTPTDLAPWLADAQINRDRNLRLQFLAGLSLNRYESGPIYANMLRNARYPEGMFSGSPESVETLRNAIQRMIGR